MVKRDVPHYKDNDPDMPQKPHIRDLKTEELVESLSGYGVPQADIARLAGVSVDTMNKYYRAAIERGVAKANAAVAQRLWQLAMNGPPVAAFFWAKTRMQWRERVDVNLTLNRDPDSLTDAELAAIAGGGGPPVVDSEASEVEPPDVGDRIH